MDKNIPWILRTKKSNIKDNLRFYIVTSILNIIIATTITLLVNDLIGCSTTHYKPIEIIRLKKLEQIKKKFRIGYERIIEKNIKRGLKSKKKKWSKKNIKTLVNVLNAGEIEFKINHRDILSIIRIESEFKIVVKSKKNTNGTRDYGITQINGPNIRYLYKKAARILAKHGVRYSNRKNKYDLALNTMACICYLDWARHKITVREGFNVMRWIISYNRGVRGSKHSNSKNKYWNKFLKARNLFI